MITSGDRRKGLGEHFARRFQGDRVIDLAAFDRGDELGGAVAEDFGGPLDRGAGDVEELGCGVGGFSSFPAIEGNLLASTFALSLLRLLGELLPHARCHHRPLRLVGVAPMRHTVGRIEASIFFRSVNRGLIPSGFIGSIMLSHADLLRLAVRAHVHESTARNWHSGGTCRPVTRAALQRACRALGLPLPGRPSASPATTAPSTPSSPPTEAA